MHRASTARPATSSISRCCSTGCEAEREQGITIDVAYRYFATPRRALHRRRHAGPRAVHPQHGDRRVEPPSSPSSWSTRRKGLLTQTLPALRHRLAARHPSRRAGGQQDGPGRLRRSGASTRSSHELRRNSPRALGFEQRHARSRSRARHGDNVSRPARTCRGTAGRRCSQYLENVDVETAPSRPAVPHAGAVDQSADISISAAIPERSRAAAVRAGDAVVVAPIGPRGAGRAHRHRRRATSSGAPSGDAVTLVLDRRARHRARRRARRPAHRAARRRPVRRAPDLDARGACFPAGPI